MENNKNVKHQFTNPILSGFYPDPSICKAGDDFYLINSTFSYFPGIPIFQSRNLISWKLIGHVMNRPEQMNLDGLGLSRGIFAPAISYNEGMFYVVCTLVDAGGNFVVTSKKPEGPWSNPVFMPEIDGIDPSLFFDDDGKTWIVYNSIPPESKSLYDGHRTIRLYEFDKNNLKVIGEEKILVNGGTDIRKKPIWIEGPHLYKVNDMYYLMCAEGGTSEWHSEVIFKSDNIDGPYTPYENNPILTQRHLDPKRENAVTCTGHADMVQLSSGDWWAVFLGCRPYQPYENNHFNTGRETFLAPVKWIDGWPVINPDHEQVQNKYDYPIPTDDKIDQAPYGDNFTVKDDFNSSALGLDWLFLRTPHEKWYHLEKKKGRLSIQLRKETCSGKKNPSFIGRRQQHLSSSAIAAMEFEAKSENEKAGLLIFQNESHYYFICKSMTNNDQVIQLYQSTENVKTPNQLKLLTEQAIQNKYASDPVYLKIASNGGLYSFYYSSDNANWEPLKENVDGTFLSTKTAGGFVGSMYAMYATSLGIESANIVHFDWFEYTGNDAANN
ncbi:MAG: glycoside hydrolase family 43 protein [Calditrichaceae bacterium]|nr:glycoside hydrolase family 43 protein [Calditrichaceae bacterium]